MPTPASAEPRDDTGEDADEKRGAALEPAAATEHEPAAAAPEEVAVAPAANGAAALAEPGPESEAPAVASTYDPSRAKRAGWWSKARAALSGKDE
jgi:ribonuclease E